MKKFLTLGMVLALSTSMTLAASSYGDAFKKAVKQDIATMKQEAKDYNKSVKESFKKDLEAKAKAKEEAKTKAIKAKKAEDLKEVNSKIAELNKERAAIQANKNMTFTEKTLKTKAIDKQLEYYNKQKELLK
ncbi:MAG: hypothetical protein IJW73_07920 [Candidatus Gastranaerophilales bacterium]|nr:hypothetical protein [Candidatus Gastranaerophilales bacterium]